MNLPPLLNYTAIAFRTVIVLIFLTVGMRLVGKRSAGKMNLIDILMIVLIANAVQNAITTGSGDLLVGLVAAGVVLLIDHWLGTLFFKYPEMEKHFFGEPIVIVTNGQPNQRAMRRAEVSKDQVLTAVHEQGLKDLSDVRLVVLENDGTLSVIPKEQQPQ